MKHVDMKALAIAFGVLYGLGLFIPAFGAAFGWCEDAVYIMGSCYPGYGPGFGGAVIGAFYYLRVIKLMYFDEPLDHHPIEAPMDMRIVLGFNALALLVVGIMPEKLMEICIYTITSSLS